MMLLKKGVFLIGGFTNTPGGLYTGRARRYVMQTCIICEETKNTVICKACFDKLNKTQSKIFTELLDLARDRAIGHDEEALQKHLETVEKKLNRLPGALFDNGVRFYNICANLPDDEKLSFGESIPPEEPPEPEPGPVDFPEPEPSPID